MARQLSPSHVNGPDVLNETPFSITYFIGSAG